MKLKIKVKNKITSSLLFLIISIVSQGCGYALQSRVNPLVELHGIRRIYIAPFLNNSYKPGVENLVYNQVLKVIAANSRVRLTFDKEKADAVLQGVVQSADYGVASTSPASSLAPNGRFGGVPIGDSQIGVATYYRANLNCSFSLMRRNKDLSRDDPLWAGSASRSKDFPSNNMMGVFGSTSALINESEFERSLLDLAVGISQDIHESMFAMF